MTVLKLTEGLGLTECRQDTYSKQQRIPATRQGIVKILPAMKLLWMSRRGIWLAIFQWLISSNHFQNLVHRRLYFWIMDIMTKATVYSSRESASCLHFNLSVHIFCEFLGMDITLNLVKTTRVEHRPHFNIAFTRKIGLVLSLLDIRE